MTLTHDEAFLLDITFSPDGSRIATVSPMNEKVKEEIGVFEWDATTGQELRMFPVETLSMYSVAYSPDGDLLAAGIQEGDILVWNTTSGELVRRLTGHTGLAFELAFSSDSRRLASASKDNTAKLWDVTTGLELATLYGQTGSPNTLTYSPDGAHIVTADNDGTIRTYVVDTGELVALARSRVTRSLTTQECQKYLHVEECPERP
jgi:WD40 repeat protein